MIVIIDYGAGNLFNIENAIRRTGKKVCISDNAKIIESSRGVILPGVGHARTAMEALERKGLIDILRQKVLIDKVPFLGICLGMQLLFEESEEGNVKCLGWLNGKVHKIQSDLKVPEIGWNNIAIKRNMGILEGISNNSDFYFIHSYCVNSCNIEDIVATTEYGKEFVSMVQRDNIIGTQFHPEKSGEVGSRLILNYCNMVAKEE